MSYRMLALDLDNTLLSRDLTATPAAREGVARLLNRGVIVTLATGRMFPSARKYAREFGITAPLATYNGALIRSADGSFPEILRPLPREKVEKIIAFCEEHRHYVQLYHEDTLICGRYTKETDIDPDLLNCPYREVGDLKTAAHLTTPKMVMVVEPAEAPAITEALKKAVGDDLYIAASKNYLIEIMRRDVSKATALQLICEHLGVEAEEVVCCGDNSNDAAMVQWAGMGVAMGNASPALKAVADYTAAAAYGDGVAEAIRRFF